MFPVCALTKRLPLNTVQNVGPWDCGRGKRDHKANPGKKDVRTGTSLQANRIGIDTHNAIRYPADPPGQSSLGADREGQPFFEG
jgi:hypothetical protein